MKTFILNAKELITEIKHEKIQIQTKEVRMLWDDLMELTMARHEALIGARKVHSFDRKIDETLDLMLKTETPLSINSKDHGNIEELEQMKNDLSQNVNDINKEADSLVSMYPDAIGHINAKKNKLTNAVKGLDNTLLWLKSKRE